MVNFGSMRCHLASLLALACLSATVAGCSTVAKTFDMTPDPELNRPGVYPNINVAGAAPPGKVLTPDEQAKAAANLKARGAQSSPSYGAAAKQQADTTSKELSNLAATHAQKTLKDIQEECQGTDATKCPQ